jgi:hypothetical protein
MNFNLEEIKKLPRRSSKDYLELMHLALEMNDKEWFEELAKEKARLEKLEEEARRELGWTGTN